MSISYLFSSTHMFTIDNDAFVTNEDGQYTGGLFYTYMSDTNNSFGIMQDLKTNSAISVSHIIFTPEDKNSSDYILDDSPYAGYLKVNFLLYKSTNDYFHEFGINVGVVGPITKAKQIQSEFHGLIGQIKPKGWDNQLENKATIGISYNFAKKTKPLDIYGLKFDWTNNGRFDIGNFYSGVLAASTFRISSKAMDTFATTGNFIDGDESSSLNTKFSKKFHWAISLGFFANKVKNYHIIDEAIDLGYTIPEVDYFTGEQISYDIFYNNIQYALKIKSVHLQNHKLISSSKKQWGGITIIWKF